MITPSTLRIVLRWLHIMLGLIMMCYVYSPFGKLPAYQIFVKFFVIPVIALSGMGLWKFKAFNKFLRIRE